MLRLYYADIRGLDEADALYPPRRASPGSAFGTSLLAYAYQDTVGLTPRKLARTLLGEGGPLPTSAHAVPADFQSCSLSSLLARSSTSLRLGIAARTAAGIIRASIIIWGQLSVCFLLTEV